MVDRYDEANKVTYKTISLNIGLAIIKIFAGIVGKSGAMIADGLHSASDIITSLGVLIGNYISSKPLDKEHNYGHEKAETLVAFILSIILMLVALLIGYQSIKSLFNLNEVKIPTILPLIVAMISILIKEYQYRITIKVASEINSPSLKADAWHHRSDSLSSIAAFIGIAGAILGLKFLEPIASVIVAVFVLKVGFDILKNSINELMDVSIGDEQENEIKKIIKSMEGVKKLNLLRTRKHGSGAYVDIVVCVDGDLTVIKGHDIATNLEQEIRKEISIVKGITIHVEPFIDK